MIILPVRLKYICKLKEIEREKFDYGIPAAFGDLSGKCGGLGGNFPVKKSLSDSLVLMCLKIDKARSQFASYGKGYDPTTGWFCWKGSI